MYKKGLIIFLLVLWAEFEEDYRIWRSHEDNIFEDNFEQATIHTFFKWLKWKQLQK